MFEGPLRMFSIVASLIVIGSFAMFAIDQARSGSQSSQAGIAKQTYVAAVDPSGFVDPTPAEEKVREAAHSSPREYLDDADDMLLAPFASFGSTNSSAWVRRSIPGAIALLIYGFGAGYLARFAAGRA